MNEFKAGNRVKQIVNRCGFKSPYAIVTRIEGNHVWHIHDGETEELNCESSWLVLVSRESIMSRYQELKEKIKNLQIGWDKEADDLVNELANRFDCFVAIKVYHDGGKDEKYKGTISVELGNRLADSRFHFYSQCEKLEAFKQALLWLLDHSDIKKDEKEEKIKDLEYQRDTFVTQVRSLNLQIKELMGVKK